MRRGLQQWRDYLRDRHGTKQVGGWWGGEGGVVHGHGRGRSAPGRAIHLPTFLPAMPTFPPHPPTPFFSWCCRPCMAFGYCPAWRRGGGRRQGDNGVCRTARTWVRLAH